MDGMAQLKALLSGKNSSQVEIDPLTGEPMVKVPENRDELTQLAQAGAATPMENPSGPPQYLATTPDQRERQNDLEDMQFREMFRGDRKKVQEAINRQTSDVEALKQTGLDYRSMGTDVNFKPLAGFLETINPSLKGFSESLPDAETPEQRAQKIAAIQNMIANASGDVSDKSLDLLRATVARAQSQQQGKQSRFEAAQTAKLETEIQKDLQKNIFDPLKQAQSDLGSIEANLERGNLQGLSDSLAAYVRTVQGQKGVLTDQDIGLAKPRSLDMTLANVEAYLKGNRDIDLEKDVLKPLRDGVGIAKKNLGSVYKGQLDTKRKIYSARSSTAGLMTPGGSGDVMHKQAELMLNAFEAPKEKDANADLVSQAKAALAAKRGAR